MKWICIYIYIWYVCMYICRFYMDDTREHVFVHWQQGEFHTMSELPNRSELSFKHGPQNLKDTFRRPLWCPMSYPLGHDPHKTDWQQLSPALALADRRLTARSRKVLNPRDWILWLSYRFKIDRHLDSFAVDVPVKFQSDSRIEKILQ